MPEAEPTQEEQADGSLLTEPADLKTVSKQAQRLIQQGQRRSFRAAVQAGSILIAMEAWKGGSR